MVEKCPLCGSASTQLRGVIGDDRNLLPRCSLYSCALPGQLWPQIAELMAAFAEREAEHEACKWLSQHAECSLRAVPYLGSRRWLVMPYMGDIPIKDLPDTLVAAVLAAKAAEETR